jgi:hypothetical protein
VTATNTLAYNSTEFTMTLKSFMIQSPEGRGGGELGGVVIKKRGCTYYLENFCFIESYFYHLNTALGSRFTFKTTRRLSKEAWLWVDRVSNLKRSTSTSIQRE